MLDIRSMREHRAELAEAMQKLNEPDSAVGTCAGIGRAATRAVDQD